MLTLFQEGENILMLLDYSVSLNNEMDHIFKI